MKLRPEVEIRRCPACDSLSTKRVGTHHCGPAWRRKTFGHYVCFNCPPATVEAFPEEPGRAGRTIAVCGNIWQRRIA